MTSLLKTSVFGRIAALTAMLVIGFGKTLHLHQECGGCCSSSCHSAKSEPKTCPFGCTHHHSDHEKQPQNPRSGHEHSEHNCVICKVLGQAPSMPVLVGLPELPEYLYVGIRHLSAQQSKSVPAAFDSRGPPAATTIPAA